MFPETDTPIPLAIGGREGTFTDSAIGWLLWYIRNLWDWGKIIYYYMFIIRLHETNNGSKLFSSAIDFLYYPNPAYNHSSTYPLCVYELLTIIHHHLIPILVEGRSTESEKSKFYFTDHHLLYIRHKCIMYIYFSF